MHDTPGLRFDTVPDASPITLMRLGGRDLAPGLRAVEQGARPSAVITGLGEGREVIRRARQLTRQQAMAWLSDPLLFRTALSGYRTAHHLQTLDYTPGRDADPYEPAEFGDADMPRRIGRAVVGAQMDLGASAALSGAFVIAGMQDPWLAVNQGLLRAGADAAAGWDAPVIAEVPLRLMGFDDVDAQRLLVRALSARRPAAWLLMLDGLSEDSSAERIFGALRFALLLQAAAPVILARSGDLRRLFWAFGVGGTEFGLGRHLRFAVPDFTKQKGGPGPTPGPRVELPSLACALPFARAQRLLVGELVAEARCSCPACAAGSSPQAGLARIAEHDAHVVTAQARELSGYAPAARVDRLDGDLQAAISRWRRLELSGAGLGSPQRLERQRRALDLAVRSGLLEPARLVGELRLFE